MKAKGSWHTLAAKDFYTQLVGGKEGFFNLFTISKVLDVATKTFFVASKVLDAATKTPFVASKVLDVATKTLFVASKVLDVTTETFFIASKVLDTILMNQKKGNH